MKMKRAIFPILFLACNLFVLGQAFVSDTSWSSLKYWQRQYSHMTFLVLEIYILFATKRFDLFILFGFLIAFSLVYHSGQYLRWTKADAWLSQVAIVYVAGTIPCTQRDIVALLSCILMVMSVYLEYGEWMVGIGLAAAGLAIIAEYKKYDWRDLIASAITFGGAYACFRMETVGLHGMWHSLCATAVGFAITVPKTYQWHLLGIIREGRTPRPKNYS